MNCCLTPLNSGRLRPPALPWVLMLVIALPASAVVAGLTTLGICLRHGDRELPAMYHWEGESFDRDQALQDAAARRGIGASVRLLANGDCQLILRGAAPARLRLSLTHPTNPARDQVVTLVRDADRYAGHCGGLPVAHWWIAVNDSENQWLLRTRSYGGLRDPVPLGAHGPGS